MAYDSSDDDMPLAKTNGHLSKSRVPKSVDKEMDKAASKAKPRPEGVSIRNGPVDDGAMDVDDQPLNGSSKRKSRSSISKAVNYKDGSDDSDDGAPLAKRRKSKHKIESDSDDEPISKKRGLPPSAGEMMGYSSDDDKPLNNLAKTKAKIEKSAAQEAKKIRAAESKAKKPTPKKAIKDESDDEPLAKGKVPKRQSNGVASSAKKANGVKKAPSKANLKAEAKAPAKGKKAATEEADSDAEEEYRWWDAPKQEDDSIKWTTLEHNGVMFPPEYEPLPKNVSLVYNGTPVVMHPDAEEVAGFFGAMLHQPHHTENPVFQKNFFTDFKEVLKETGGAKDRKGNKVDIKEFSKLDFQQIFEFYKGQSDAKKALSAAEKKALKAEKDEREAPFTTCVWDGRKEKVGNFRVEPPGLFRGRGEHPKTGKLKQRVAPEQITINIGKHAKVPTPPAGHKWKTVQHDGKVSWLAMWQENINGSYKYVMLNAASAVKGQADWKKFEKARELKKHIDRIRADYTRELKSEVMAERQRATAIYLIDKFALRAGNEKDTENEAETVGCCSLKFEHLTLREPNTVIFDFLGKDSIRFYDEVVVDRTVFKNLKLFKRSPKSDGDDIFDRLNTTQLNKHLGNYMQGLSAKVFRTYNASYTMSKKLQELTMGNASLSNAEKVAIYNRCNKEVAILCNHKRTVGAGHETQMEKLGDRIKALKYEKWRLKMQILDLDPKQKKKKGSEYFQLDEDLNEEWIQSHQAFKVEEMRTKITKKFQKENEKLVAEKERPMPDKELKERMKAATELEKKYNKENKSKKVEAEGKSPSVEKIEAQITKKEELIRNTELQATEREDNKEVALGTSKINYIDPRLTVVFCNKFEVPIEKFFSKTLRDKFNWAIQSVGDDDKWEF